jgi:predicted adenine nucleotide alpha hydrolase (AANH) superfamily ATPase
LEWLRANDFTPTIFFFNPNIWPTDEYTKRKEECVRYATELGVEFWDGDYNHAEWLARVAGLESEPERGSRCAACFAHRLNATALLAAERGFEEFTTTLGGSRWKDFAQIVDAGNRAAGLAQGVRFWDKDWKKGGLTERRAALLRQNGFYNQRYCGCEFSLSSFVSRLSSYSVTNAMREGMSPVVTDHLGAPSAE